MFHQSLFRLILLFFPFFTFLNIACLLCIYYDIWFFLCDSWVCEQVSFYNYMWFLSFFFAAFLLFVLPWSDLLVYYVCCLILFSYPLDSYLVSNKREKGNRS